MFFIQDPIPFPENLSEHLRVHFEAERSMIASELKLLWPKLAVEKGVSIDPKKHYSASKRQALAYALYYLPANLMKFPVVFQELATVNPESLKRFQSQPKIKILDFGCGPGTVFWGLDVLSKQYNLSFEYLGCDQSREFVDLGTSFSKPLQSDNPKIKAQFQSVALSQEAILSKVGEFKPDFIVFSNSIGEIFPDLESRKKFSDSFIRKLEQINGDGETRIATFIEPALKSSSRELLELRQHFLTQNPGRVEVCLPCLSNRPCGALDAVGEWCHETVAIDFPEWISDLGEKAGLKKEQLLFSYSVFTVGASLKNANWPEAGARVVSQVMKEKGLQKCFICTANKGRTLGRVLNSKVTSETEKFTTVVRGSIIKNLELSEKGDFLSGEILD